jgi:hypothetical protein
MLKSLYKQQLYIVLINLNCQQAISLFPVPRTTFRTVDQTPPNERKGASVFMVWTNTAWSTLGAGLVNRLGIVQSMAVIFFRGITWSTTFLKI